MVQIGPLHLVLGAEPVLHLASGYEIDHLGVHHPAPVPWRHVEHVRYAAGLPVMENDHADLDLSRWNHEKSPSSIAKWIGSR